MTLGARGPAGSTPVDRTPAFNVVCADAHTWSVRTPRGHLGAGLAHRPRRVPRVAGHVLAAQRGFRVRVGDDVAQLLEALIVDAGPVEAPGRDVRLQGRRAASARVARRSADSGAARSSVKSYPTSHP